MKAHSIKVGRQRTFVVQGGESHRQGIVQNCILRAAEELLWGIFPHGLLCLITVGH